MTGKPGRSGKGPKFERDVCKRLSLWVTELEEVDCFWRTAISGGRATVRAKRTGVRDKTSSGDITAITPAGAPLLDIFTVECKHIKDPHWLSCIHNVKPQKSNLLGFWKQAQEQCVDTSPLLIMRQNFQREMMFTDALGYAVLRKASTNGTVKRIVTFHKHGMIGMYFDDLFKYVKFKTLLRVWKEWPDAD